MPRADPVDTVTAIGGVARTATLLTRGVSRHRLARALDVGALQRVRRGWVALPQADAELVNAARHGVVLSCITRARRLGVFVLDEPEPHVAAPAHSGAVVGSRAHVHWAKPLVPRHPDALEDPIENALALVAACRAREPALAVWESALRQGLVHAEAMARLDMSGAARSLLEEASPWSDSGLETFVPPRLRWLGLPIRQQIWIAGHRVDFLIGDRLVLQADGGSHVGAQRERDIAHDAALTLMGYHVIRVGYGQIVDRWHEVQELIMAAVAQGLHRAR